MPTAHTPLQSLARRRFLFTAWPARSLGYLLSTLPVVAAAALPLMVLALPWLILVILAVEDGGELPVGAVVLLAPLGALLVAAFGPLVAMPFAALERRRLRIIDDRPVVSGHRSPPSVGLWPWLRARYGETATWREVGYTALLVTLVPALAVAVMMYLAWVALLIAGPALVDGARGDESVVLVFDQLTTVGEALPYALLGMLLLPTVPYAWTAAAGAHGALARALLHSGNADELRTRLVEVARSRSRLVDAFEAERRRIERDLHDGAQRRLVGLTLQLGLARLDVPPGSPAADAVTDAHTQAKELMAELRELIRGIHPQILTDRGLAAALRELADDCVVPVAVSTDLPDRLERHVEDAAYFVVSEALTNVAKHSGATEVSISAGLVDDVVTVDVVDNGHGGADPRRGTGLTGMADRLAVVDGRMFVSSPVGGPTRLRVELPCNQSEPRPE